MPSQTHVHAEEVWGTVVSIHVPLHRSSAHQAQAGVVRVVEWLHHVDRLFSTYKADSAVSMIRDGKLTVAEAPAEVREVATRCQRLCDLTTSAFDPWRVSGGFDPSGLVKGWAADRAAELLGQSGCPDAMVAAGGDVTVRGEAAAGHPWTIGIQHPDNPAAIYTTVTATDCAIATSGRYERGDHIAADGPITAKSATVVGPDGATADGLATAVLIVGVPALEWFAHLAGYSAQVVVGDRVTSIGPAFSAGSAISSPQ